MTNVKLRAGGRAGHAPAAAAAAAARWQHWALRADRKRLGARRGRAVRYRWSRRRRHRADRFNPCVGYRAANDSVYCYIYCRTDCRRVAVALRCSRFAHGTQSNYRGRTLYRYYHRKPFSVYSRPQTAAVSYRTDIVTTIY